MIPPYPAYWTDPASSWCVKANRAKEHIEALRHEVDTYRESEPYRVVPEATEIQGRLAYRLDIKKPMPTAISAIIGDVVHNLRAALECLAFELARRSHDVPLTKKQEQDSTFPICVTPDKFDEFFAKRKGLYDERAITAFRMVQPFFADEEALRLGIEPALSFEERARFDSLYRLDKVWNIDKHRRLTLAVWQLHLTYWGSNGPTGRRMSPGDGTGQDGSVLYYIEGTDGPGQSEIVNEFNLVLTDDPGFNGGDGDSDVVELLEQWHQAICSLNVFPRIFTMMSQQV